MTLPAHHGGEVQLNHEFGAGVSSLVPWRAVD